MRILFNNVNFKSRSGPNGFGLKLARQLHSRGHDIVNENADVALSFIQGNIKNIKNVLRLDGIYFNSAQAWRQLNEPIKQSYDLADEIIVQSNFNARLVREYFGKRENVHVIHNGTDLSTISSIPKAKLPIDFQSVWLCASSWRPHKRLKDNIHYFQRVADQDDVLIVAGDGDLSAMHAAKEAGENRIIYAGHLDWQSLIAAMQLADHFIHLAFLDHCPNVVVDALAAGCKIHCSSSGGTHEIAGANAAIIEEDTWDFLPLELYNPPPLQFSRIKSNKNYTIKNDIVEVASMYEDVLL